MSKKKQQKIDTSNVIFVEDLSVKALKIHLGSAGYRRLEALAYKNQLHPYAQWKELQAEERDQNAQ